MNAWTVIKEGQYSASSNWWMLRCIAEKKKDSLAKAREIAGQSLSGSGLRAVKITIEITDQ